MVALVTIYMKYTKLLQNLGLPKNEALVYEALISDGHLSITQLAHKTGIHRRNIYDTLGRLTEKGYVFEVLGGKENLYAAADPNKLREEVSERQKELESAIPELEQLYSSTPKKEEVYVLKGIEGWKTFMRQVLRLKEDFYAIGGKGMWNEQVLGSFFTAFQKEAERQGIGFNIIYDPDIALHSGTELGATFGHLPEGFASASVVMICGDHVAINSRPREGGVGDDVITIIINQLVADTFRMWWKLMWERCIE